jgi:hypothetical protein
MDRLGRIPQVGDVVEIPVRRMAGPSEAAVIRLQVEAVAQHSVTRVRVGLPSGEGV